MYACKSVAISILAFTIEPAERNGKKMSWLKNKLKAWVTEVHNFIYHCIN